MFPKVGVVGLDSKGGQSSDLCGRRNGRKQMIPPQSSGTQATLWPQTNVRIAVDVVAWSNGARVAFAHRRDNVPQSPRLVNPSGTLDTPCLQLITSCRHTAATESVILVHCRSTRTYARGVRTRCARKPPPRPVATHSAQPRRGWLGSFRFR